MRERWDTTEIAALEVLLNSMKEGRVESRPAEEVFTSLGLNDSVEEKPGLLVRFTRWLGLESSI